MQVNLTVFFLKIFMDMIHNKTACAVKVLNYFFYKLKVGVFEKGTSK